MRSFVFDVLQIMIATKLVVSIVFLTFTVKKAINS